MSARLLAMTLFCLSAVSCNGPLPFLSGGRLGGEVRVAPAAWSFDESFAVIQLETNPEDPYSVNIAYTVVDDQLYIYAGDTRTQWVENMEADPRVRFRLDDTIYELRAERVTDRNKISTFAKAWVSHSMIHRDPETLDEVWLYRLAAR